MSTTSFRNYLVAAQELLLVEADSSLTSNGGGTTEQMLVKTTVDMIKDPELQPLLNPDRKLTKFVKGDFVWEAYRNAVKGGIAAIGTGKQGEQVAAAVYEGWLTTQKEFVANPDKFQPTVRGLSPQQVEGMKDTFEFAITQKGTYQKLSNAEKQKYKAMAEFLQTHK